jgi:hypothetical protein
MPTSTTGEPSLREIVVSYAKSSLSSDSVLPPAASAYQVGNLAEAQEVLHGAEPPDDPARAKESPLATLPQQASTTTTSGGVSPADIPVTAVVLRGKFELIAAKGLGQSNPRGDELILFVQTEYDNVPSVVGQFLVDTTANPQSSAFEARLAERSPRAEIQL